MRVAVRLTSRAAIDRIDGVVADAAGGSALKVSVTAAPAGNRANDALLHLLAREWRLPRRGFALAGGGKSRNKAAAIGGDPAALLAGFEPLIAALPRR